MHDGLNISVSFFLHTFCQRDCCLCSAGIIVHILVIVYDFQTEACANMETCL